MRRTRLAVLFLSLALISPWGASAAGPKSEPGREAASSLWTWLTHLWAEAGCRADPSGCPTGAAADPSAGSQVDNGCKIDPSGTPCTEGQ